MILESRGKSIVEPERKINILKEVDVLVVGGGVAGVAAAVAAARNGANTILIERYGHLGGLATGGLVLVIMPMSDGTNNLQIAGICGEIISRLDAYQGCIHPRKEDLGSSEKTLIDYWRNYPFCVVNNHIVMSAPFDPEILKLVLNDMVEESGVSLNLHCWGCQAIVEGNTVKGVIFESKQGRHAVLARVTIDTTGDGDVLATAGADYIDTITDELRAHMALPFRLGGIDFQAFGDFRRFHQSDFLERMKELGHQLGLKGPTSSNYFLLRYSQPDAAWVNNSFVNHSGLKIEDLTRVEVSGRKNARTFYEFYRKNIPGFEKSYIMDVAPQIGVRCSRRLIGQYVIDHKELMKGVIYPDTIGVLPDHHHTCSPDHPHWHIPYRSLVSRNRENLLAAGRLISADAAANELLRPIQGCIMMGEAAGTAAALAVKSGVHPGNVDIKMLQRQLLNQGALLEGVPI
ncbi:MAG TPA: FAD-dependent oxidoreductase [Dehalococcoidales bacterium]|nr:FAD-dependent oxidoreductase [Dehalococcoidales bacterium]